MPNSIMVVVGTPGAGKTSVLTGLKSATRIEHTIVNIGTLMEEMAVTKGYAKDRDQLRYMPNEKIAELRRATFGAVAKMPGNVIVDTHATIEQHGRYVPGLPRSETMLLEKGLTALVCVDASTEEILTRRSQDKTRKREVEDARFVEMQRIINLSTLSSYSLSLNIPLYVIDNKQGMLEHSVRRFAEIAEEVFNK
ncbi:MAG: AAA family ATPase [Candidatus Marsarchaeota archaeon]|nr:AAA family ATPase [Candidatus Marsarchaeota archaeon]